MILTPDRYRRMPWANGKGVTEEMLRIDGPDGLVLRLSRAQVVEDGDFSLFPGIDRSLTVLTGPGFDLEGDGLALQARPMLPVAFPGDVPVRAIGVTAPCDDFNVMTARALPRPEVRVMQAGQVAWGDWLVLYALGAARVGERALPDRALMLVQGSARLTEGRALAVKLEGLDPDPMRKIG